MAAIAKKIRGLSVRDIRFPTSLDAYGSDAMYTDPDYSCAYVILYTDTDVRGFGFTFTIGRGTEIVVSAVKALTHLVVGRELKTIYDDFGGFWRELTSESQLRWLGPEKGVLHLATAAIVNALWDLWAKIEGKPVWKLLVDMEPEKLVSTIDFRYISDALTKEEAIAILKNKQPTKDLRESKMRAQGYPAYTTSVGWLGYEDQKLRNMCSEFLAQGFTKFKAKVGANFEDDRRRLKIIREEIGETNILMVDANQRWDVSTSIEWMKGLADFKPLWIEEPTSPDDVLGHVTIRQALEPYGIGVATGEQCQNRVMFKQFLQAKGLDFCQIDSCRLGGVNEILSVYLMAAKFGVPVCPHAGGVGLCELVQHLAFWDYIAVSGSLENRMVEYVDQLHKHFTFPVKLENARYMMPAACGYSSEIKEASLLAYEFPFGEKWKELFAKGLFPSLPGR